MSTLIDRQILFETDETPGGSQYMVYSADKYFGTGFTAHVGHNLMTISMLLSHVKAVFYCRHHKAYHLFEGRSRYILSE